MMSADMFFFFPSGDILTSRPAPPFNTSLIVPIDFSAAAVRRDEGLTCRGFNV